MAELTIQGKDMMQELKITISWPKTLGFRMWLTRKIIAFAGFVSPIKIDADIHRQGEKPSLSPQDVNATQ
jgi:hypothetical protein